MNHPMTRVAILCAVIAYFHSLFAGELPAAVKSLPGLEGVPEVVAEVQGKPIARIDLIRELVGSSGAKSLERLINRILIEQAAAQRKIVVSDQDIEQQFKRDQNELAQTFIRMPWMNQGKAVPVDDIIRAQFGISVAEYKNTVIRQRLLSRRCMAREINPSESDLRKFFQSYPDLFQHPVKYRASHILITPLNPNDLNLGNRLRSSIAQKMDYRNWLNKRLQQKRDQNIEVKDEQSGLLDEVDPAWAKARATAEQLATQLMANPSKWNEYVLTYSQDPMDRMRVGKNGMRLPTQREQMKLRMVPGDVDWFHKDGPLVKEFYNGAKDLKPGQISLPVQTQFGYHIIKMLQVYRPPVVTYADCQDRVRELYIENEIQLLSSSWLAQLSRYADLKTEKATLWPPRKFKALEPIGLPDPTQDAEQDDPDPVVGRVNGTAIRRSEVWQDLLRSEGEEALKRLINREVVLGILKKVGIAHMEWLCANPDRRPKQAPPISPIKIDEEQIQKELNEERLAHDGMQNSKEYANLSFDEYIYKRFGQTPAEYRRAIEAGAVMINAVRQKVVPRNRDEFERTLRFEFALARSQYSDDAWFEVSHILVPPAGGMYKADIEEMMAARTTANDVLQRCIADPDKWNDLVEMFSFDSAENKAAHGYLGACYEGRTLPEFPESAQFYNEIVKQNLEPGQFTPVLQSARGFHIVRLDKKHPARQAEYADKRAQVERDFINEQARYYSEIWVRALNSRAIVKHFYFKPPQSYDEPDVDPISIPEDTFTLPKN